MNPQGELEAAEILHTLSSRASHEPSRLRRGLLPVNGLLESQIRVVRMRGGGSKRSSADELTANSSCLLSGSTSLAVVNSDMTQPRDHGEKNAKNSKRPREVNRGHPKMKDEGLPYEHDDSTWPSCLATTTMSTHAEASSEGSSCTERIVGKQEKVQKNPSKPRSGKWTAEEQEYARCIFDAFVDGVLDISDGTTLRCVGAVMLLLVLLRIIALNGRFISSSIRDVAPLQVFHGVKTLLRSHACHKEVLKQCYGANRQEGGTHKERSHLSMPSALMLYSTLLFEGLPPRAGCGSQASYACKGRARDARVHFQGKPRQDHPRTR